MNAALVHVLLLLPLATISSPAAPQATAGGQPSPCGSCHAAQARQQPQTSMAHSLEHAAESTILKTHPALDFAEGSYRYRIERRGNQSIYSVADEHETFSAPIAWAFGLGRAGQTYVFEVNGKFYESRVSFYRELDGLDLTIGAKNHSPANLTEAAGRLINPDEELRCFGCHATNATQGKRLTLGSLIPGVQCERCHGSSTSHLEGLRTGNVTMAAMQKLGKLSTEQMSNFCGQCHRTWEEISLSGQIGINSVRFQPYRLTNSKCYDAEDARIRCVSCHNPHEEIVQETRYYDAKCQACHAGKKRKAPSCKVSSKNCASCHMPGIELPGSHHKFTDHEIRIVRKNEPYPE